MNINWGNFYMYFFGIFNLNAHPKWLKKGEPPFNNMS